MVSIAAYLALALSALALGVSIITLWFQRSPPDVSALKSQLHNVDADLSELADRMNHWMRRDSTRAARAARELPPPMPASPADRKSELRRRAVQLRNGAGVQ